MNKTYIVRYKDGVEEMWECNNLTSLKEALGKDWKEEVLLIAEVKYENWDIEE